MTNLWIVHLAERFAKTDLDAAPHPPGHVDGDARIRAGGLAGQNGPALSVQATIPPPFELLLAA
jgi:hypothetical protein